jgi:hypothetical protein
VLVVLSSSDAASVHAKLIQHLAVFRGYKGQIECLNIFLLASQYVLNACLKHHGVLL